MFKYDCLSCSYNLLDLDRHYAAVMSRARTDEIQWSNGPKLSLVNQGSPTFRDPPATMFSLLFFLRDASAFVTPQTIGHNDKDKRIFSSIFKGLKPTYVANI